MGKLRVILHEARRAAGDSFVRPARNLKQENFLFIIEQKFYKSNRFVLPAATSIEYQ
jgi:hypothetical protein